MRTLAGYANETENVNVTGKMKYHIEETELAVEKLQFSLFLIS